MTLLSSLFTENGFTVRVVERRGRVAILAKSKVRIPDRFEVVILQHRPEEMIHGRLYPAREVMPRPERWGIDGFSCFDRADAEIRFDELAREGGFSHEGNA